MLALAAGAACAPALILPPEAHGQGDGGRPPLPTPSQRPLLTVSGRIRHTNQGDAAVFDRPMLEAFGLDTIVTNSPWYDGPMRFDGVPLAKLMDAVGATGETVTAIALNDYSTDIPVADFARFGVILALLRNGEPMRVSDKGPLFIVYPYDSSPELRTRLYYSRSAWSVARLVVR
ncbi:molybdopterin-dependent oxidoreductase [Siccirubricoccus sp. KC 17139]|uniref:Molybdopterin-dependent oxidoreductase n=1 Tax=Siccirubricoccus soli TaxID=2899147 RepID=A0ABT1D1A8_9PROT|nr:molybdopterin-dependent oxidoreductase [Siccirubricoccus soli]MCP2681834.1 molybdopterin-dependent oxidoreductase [Siccirubricoccus soli]